MRVHSMILATDFYVEVATWPRCDVLIAFYSTGFPLQKAIDYVGLFEPVCVNDLVMQKVLMDRRSVLCVLDAIHLTTPRRLIVHRETWQLDADVIARLNSNRLLLNVDCDINEVVEVDADTIRVGNQLMKKPFVEKPVSSEDHNIWIYYPEQDGGGVRKLFRKKANKSSEFFPGPCPLRRNGSYIYEEFMNVNNAEDVKVYTVGEKYIHAETRKFEFSLNFH